MSRITRKQLEAKAETINTLLGQPIEDGRYDENGKYKFSEGHYTIHGAYDGYTLEQQTSEGGSTRDVLYCGFIKPRALYDLMDAFIRGIRTGQDQK